jgi:hypothetical protein
MYNKQKYLNFKNMKVSQLRQLIREEIQEALNEKIINNNHFLNEKMVINDFMSYKDFALSVAKYLMKNYKRSDYDSFIRVLSLKLKGYKDDYI